MSTPLSPYADFSEQYIHLLDLLKKGEYARAFELLVHLKHHHKHILYLYEIMGDVCYVLGLYPMGKSNIAYLIQHLSHPSTRIYLLYLKHLDALKEYDTIISLCQFLLQNKTDCPIKMYHYYGLALEKTHQINQALKCYQVAYEQDPHHPLTLSLYAHLLYKTEHYQKAYSFFRQGRDLKMKEANFWYFYGQCCSYLGFREESLHAYKTSFKLNPQFSASYLAYGLAFKRRSPKKAVRYLKRALEGEIPQHKAYRHLGDIYCELSKFELAYEMYSLALFYSSAYPEELTKIEKQLRLLAQLNPRRR